MENLMNFDKSIIKNSFYRIEPNLNNFWRTFFDNLFMIEPELKTLFRHIDFNELYAHAARASSITIRNLEQPHYLKYYLTGIGEYQININLSEVYFPVLEEAFIDALATYHLTSWDDELEHNWREFFYYVLELISDGMTNATLHREFEEFYENQQKADNHKKAA